MKDRFKTHTPPKPWAGARLMKQNGKWHTRRYWTAARWSRYVDERAARRQQRPRPQLKSTRLRLAAEEALYRNRRARMLALNAKRRAAKAQEINDTATILVRGILDNLDAVHRLMRDIGMREIAPGHWRDGLTPPQPLPALRSPGAA